MNDCLNKYQYHEHIFSISGYLPPIPIKDESNDIFLFPRCSSWGWATWSDRWEKTDWEVSDFMYFVKNKKERKNFAEGGEDLIYLLLKQQKGIINSWAIRWAYTHFKNHAYAIYPIYSKIKNIGIDGTGTNFDGRLLLKNYESKLIEIDYDLPNEIFWNPANKNVIELRKFFQLSLLRKIINFVKFGV
jgi:hypothetical protein